MYAIADVILGTYIDRDVVDVFNTLESSLEFNDKDVIVSGPKDMIGKRYDLEEFFTIQYSGSADIIPGYCGESVFSFDECDNFPVSSIPRLEDIKPEVVTKAREAYDKLPEILRNAAPPFGLYVVWSTS